MWWSVPEDPLSPREPHAGPGFSLAGHPQVCLCTSACSRCSWSGHCRPPRFLSSTCQVYLAYIAWIHISLWIGPGAHPLSHRCRDYTWATGDTLTYPTPVGGQPVCLAGLVSRSSKQIILEMMWNFFSGMVAWKIALPDWICHRLDIVYLLDR